MAKIEKTITINAPVEKVFAYMENPANLPAIWPSMVEVKNMKTEPGGGYNYDWVYKMAGVRIEGSSKTTEHEKNKRLADKSTKGIESEFIWDFRSEGAGTELSVEVAYNVPVPVLGKLAESLIVKMNEREAETLMHNLKTLLEA